MEEYIYKNSGFTKKNKKIFKTKNIVQPFQIKGVLSFAISAIGSFNPKSAVHAIPDPKRGVNKQTDIATYRLNRPRGRFNEN